MNLSKEYLTQLLEACFVRETYFEAADRIMDLAVARLEAVRPLLDILLADRSARPTGFLKDLVAFLPEAELPSLAAAVVNVLTENLDHDFADSLLTILSYQALPSLHSHLTTLFELGLKKESCYPVWFRPWRDSGLSHFPFLRERLTAADRHSDEAWCAWNAMLATREPEVVQYALDHADKVDFDEHWTLDALLGGVDHELTEQGVRKLYSDRGYHLLFPAEYRALVGDYERAPFRQFRQSHPTWHLAPAAFPEMPFGGIASGRCALCGGELHHLITFDPLPPGVPITGLSRLELATCLSCLNTAWEYRQLFYRHDKAGRPHQIGVSGAIKPPYRVESPFVPTAVRLAETPARWRWQSQWGGSTEENYHRVGGAASWVQPPDPTTCPECGQTMVFFMQLGSFLPTVNGEEWMWGDGGICYLFWCDACKVSGLLWQST